MKKIIIKWLIFAGIIMATCYLPGIEVENFGCAMLVALVLTIINLFIKPIIKLLTFPINIFTFGIFNLLLNFAILYAVSLVIPQYALDNAFSAFIASIVIAVSYCILKKI